MRLTHFPKDMTERRVYDFFLRRLRNVTLYVKNLLLSKEQLEINLLKRQLAV